MVDGYQLASQGVRLNERTPTTPQKNTTSEILRYPIKQIGDQDDYLKIQIIKYVAPGLGSVGENIFGLRTTEDALKQSGSIKNSIATIILPMPSNIQDNSSADWGSATMGPISAELAKSAYNGILSDNFVSSLASSIGSALGGIERVIQTGEGQKSFAAGTAAAAIQAATGQGDIGQLVSRASGQAFNQNVELLFNGVNMRSAFNFTFDMVPRSKEESERIKKIIRTFKVNMTPKKGRTDVKGGGLFIGPPNVFKLEYMSGGKLHPFLHTFKPSALVQMGVDYNGSGQYSSYPDATPVHMRLSLAFQELSPIYREDYLDGDDINQFKLPGTGY